MKKERFLELGLDEEQAKAAAKEFSEAVAGFVPKSRVDEVTKDKNHYKSEFERIDGELTEMKKNAKDQDELNAEITKLQTDITKSNSKHQSEIKQIKVENAIKEQGAKRIKTVLSEIDVDKITVDEDGNLVGLNEQIATLKEDEETSFLFEGEKKMEFKGANPKDSNTKPPGEIDFKTATYEELAAHIEAGGEVPE